METARDLNFDNQWLLIFLLMFNFKWIPGIWCPRLVNSHLGISGVRAFNRIHHRGNTVAIPHRFACEAVLGLKNWRISNQGHWDVQRVEEEREISSRFPLVIKYFDFPGFPHFRIAILIRSWNRALSPPPRLTTLSHCWFLSFITRRISSIFSYQYQSRIFTPPAPTQRKLKNCYQYH